MGRFDGSPAENLTAEAMIHGWEAICKLWQALSMLDSYELENPAVDTADETVKQNLRATLKLLESALEKFSCNTVYDIVGQMYNPILHELNHSDPEIEALWQRRGNKSSIGVLGESLCGAAVTVVVRPGLEVSGILRARPRVWVALPSAGCEYPAETSAGPTQQQQQQEVWSPPGAFTARELGPVAPNPTAFLGTAMQFGDFAGAPASEQVGPLPQICAASQPVSTIAASIILPGGDATGGLPLHHSGDQQGTEDGCASLHEWSPSQIPGSSSGQAVQEPKGPNSASIRPHGRPSPSDVRGGTNTPAGGVCIRGDDDVAAAPAAAGPTAVGPRGPLQLLLALRAGQGNGGCVTSTELSCPMSCAQGAETVAVRGGSTTSRGKGVKATEHGGVGGEIPPGRRHETEGASSGVSELRDTIAPGAFGLHAASEPVDTADGSLSRDVRDSGHGNMCDQQYDTNAHHFTGHRQLRLPPPPPRLPPRQLQPQAQVQEQPHAQWQQQPMQMPQVRVAVAVAPSGGSGSGAPSSAAAVPVLLAPEGAATCAASMGQRGHLPAAAPPVGLLGGRSYADAQAPEGGAGAAGGCGSDHATSSIDSSVGAAYDAAGSVNGGGGGGDTNPARLSRNSSSTLCSAAASAARVAAAAMKAAAASSSAASAATALAGAQPQPPAAILAPGADPATSRLPDAGSAAGYSCVSQADATRHMSSESTHAEGKNIPAGPVCVEPGAVAADAPVSTPVPSPAAAAATAAVDSSGLKGEPTSNVGTVGVSPQVALQRGGSGSARMHGLAVGNGLEASRPRASASPIDCAESASQLERQPAAQAQEQQQQLHQQRLQQQQQQRQLPPRNDCLPSDGSFATVAGDAAPEPSDGLVGRDGCMQGWPVLGSIDGSALLGHRANRRGSNTRNAVPLPQPRQQQQQQQQRQPHRLPSQPQQQQQQQSYVEWVSRQRRASHASSPPREHYERYPPSAAPDQRGVPPSQAQALAPSPQVIPKAAGGLGHGVASAKALLSDVAVETSPEEVEGHERFEGEEEEEEGGCWEWLEPASDGGSRGGRRGGRGGSGGGWRGRGPFPRRGLRGGGGGGKRRGGAAGGVADVGRPR